ncbi:MAG TPA: azurin [Steroidobacteraceae bacterium]|nr:azurin [Steroidobacteraceae bacterium]
MMKKLIVALGLLFAANAAFAAKNCTLSIEGNDLMKFNVTELKVPADCTDVEVVLKHVGKLPKAAMGHNWVLTKTADMQAVANAGVSAGLDKEYLPAGDKRVVAHTKVIGGGESTSVKFKTSQLTKGGDYTFFCSFPGHSALMKGKLVY